MRLPLNGGQARHVPQAELCGGEVFSFLPFMPDIPVSRLGVPDAGDTTSVVSTQKYGLFVIGGGRNGKKDGVAVGACLTIGGIAGTVDAVLEQPDDPVAAPPEAYPPAGTAVCPGGLFPSKAIVIGIMLHWSRRRSGRHPLLALSDVIDGILAFSGCIIYDESMVSPQCLIAFCREFDS